MPQQLGSSFMLPQNGGPTYEFLRRAHYEVDIQGIDSVLLAQDVNLPRYELDTVEIYHYNDRVKVASRPNPSDLRVDILDAVAPAVVQQLWDWFKLIYDPGTSAMGYASTYKRQGMIYLYDPMGVLIRVWSLFGLWPKNSPTPEEAYSYQGGHETVKIAMSLSCDRATLDGRSVSALIASQQGLGMMT